MDVFLAPELHYGQSILMQVSSLKATVYMSFMYSSVH